MEPSLLDLARAATAAWIRNQEIKRLMKQNAPKGSGPKKAKLKNIRCEGVGSLRSGKAFEFTSMPTNQASKLEEGDGISLIVGNNRRVGVVTNSPRWYGNRLELKVSYLSVFRRKQVMCITTLLGQRDGKMPYLLAPKRPRRVDF